MNKYSVFNGMNTSEKVGLYKALDADERTFKKSETILSFSPESYETGIILEGLAYLVSINNSGEENIIDYYEPGSIFGSRLSPNTNVNLYNVIAKKHCSVLFFDYSKIMESYKENCKSHRKFIENVIIACSCRNQIHIDILSQRTIRDKLLTYFGYLYEISENKELKLPIPLSDLADYICADRSAMMRELKKLNNENIISSKGKTVKLL